MFKGGIEKKSNHSLRATGATEMFAANGFTAQGGKINVNQPENLELLTMITMVVLLEVMHHTALPMTTGHLANSMGTESRTFQVGRHCMGHRQILK